MVNIRYIVLQYNNATPTGYPFTYSSSQSPHQGPGVPLFKRILYVLHDLNTHVIVPHYNLNILGMARMENDITDLLLCKGGNDTFEWHLPRPYPTDDVVRDIDINNPVRLKVYPQQDASSNDTSEKEYSEYSLISLSEIEHHITGKDRLLQATPIQDIQKNENTPEARYMELLEKMRDITSAIFKQEKTDGDSGQKRKIYDNLGEEVTLLEQKVEQLLTAQ